MFKDFDELTQGEKSQIHRCHLTPPFYVSLVKYEFVTSINTYIYYVEVGLKMDANTVVIKKFNKRYSEIYDFWYKLLSKYDILKDEVFPGKLWFNRNNEEKIRNRFEKMKKCLSKLCEINDNTIIQYIIDEK